MKKLFFMNVVTALACMLFCLSAHAFTVVRETDFNSNGVGEKAVYFGAVSAPGAGDAGSVTENGACNVNLGEYSTIRVIDGNETGIPGKALKFSTSGDTENRAVLRTCNAYTSAVNLGMTENDLVGVISYKIKTNFAQLDPVTQNQRNGTDVFQMNFNNGNNGAFVGQIMLQFRRNGVVSPLNQTPAPAGCIYTPNEWNWVMVIIHQKTEGKYLDIYINGKIISANNPTATGLSNFQTMFALNSAQQDTVYIDDFLVYTTAASNIEGLNGILLDDSTVKSETEIFHDTLLSAVGNNAFEFTVRDLTASKRNLTAPDKETCSAFIGQYDLDGSLLAVNCNPSMVPDYKMCVSLPFVKNPDAAKVRLFVWRVGHTDGDENIFPLTPAMNFDMLRDNNFDNDDIGEAAVYFGKYSAPGAGDAGSISGEGNGKSIKVTDGSEADVLGKVLKFYNPGADALNVAISALPTGVTAGDGKVIVLSYKIKTAFADIVGPAVNYFQMNFRNGETGAITGVGAPMLRFQRNGVITDGTGSALNAAVYTPGEWTQFMAVIKPQVGGTKMFDVYINGIRVASDAVTNQSLGGFQVLFALNTTKTDTVYLDDFSIYTAPASAFKTNY
ncbi:MAG: hypothetical protein M0R40_06230 [Firmicutes bacterium]|nr:hypothetical protein [Bacillota bacterium]